MNKKIEMKYKLVPFDQLSNFERMCVGISCPETLKYEIMNISGELYINSENPHCAEIIALIKKMEDAEFMNIEDLEKIETYTHHEAMSEVVKLFQKLRNERRHEDAKEVATFWYNANHERFMDDDEEFMNYFSHEFLYELFRVVKDDMGNRPCKWRDNFPTERALEAVFLYSFEAGQESRS